MASLGSVSGKESSGEQDRKREIRIGLVLYGGVSLAVYINGVCQEFFRAVRGHGVYRLLKALLGADIVVDVISGTSAGGLNGIYLAYSLCQDVPRNFLTFSELWRKHGDIGKLLRQPGAESPNSLLDGESYYQEKLEEAFRELDEQDWDKPGEEEPSHISELDLFVTGTDYAGSVFTRFDDLGHAITVKDHRTVFRLKYRHERCNDLHCGEPERQRQLAKLARITSCFPVAFPPVGVLTRDDEGDPKEDKEFLATWGHLGDVPRYYLDGGVLDNKPFSTTLDAIFHRMAPDRKVTRKLFYVEPVPETFDAAADTGPPHVVQSGMAALIQIPSYESIAGDLQDIRERNRKILGFRELVGSNTSAGEADWQATPRQRATYEKSRLNVLLDRVLRGVVRRNGHDVEIKAGDHRHYRKLFDGFYTVFKNQREQVLRSYDVDYWKRLLFHINYTLNGIEERSPQDEAAKGFCSRWIQCLEVVRFAMEELIDTRDFPWQTAKPSEVWTRVSSALDRLLAVDAGIRGLLTAPPDPLRHPSPETVSKLLGTLRNRITESDQAASRNAAPGDKILTVIEGELGQSVADGVLSESPVAKAAWESFEWVDTHRYPLQVAAGIFEMDLIETIRVSPVDAQLGLSHRDAKAKLSGGQLANFGGFFKQSWRSNDIAWGRLDGLCTIFQALLTEEAVRNAPKNGHVLGEVDKVLSSKELLNLPKEVKEWLRRLANPSDDKQYQEDLAELQPDKNKGGDGLLYQLVEFAQRDLATEGLQMVIEDSIAEQIDWNVCKTGQRDKVSFHIDERRFTEPNSGFIGIAAQQMAAEALQQGGVEDPPGFFANKCSVGQETIAKDVPKPVLVELATRAALVFRDCVVPQIEKGELQVASSSAFRYGFEWPVRLTNRLASMARYAPTSARVATWSFLFMALGFLVLGIGWWDVFLYSDAGFRPTAAILLIAFPLAFLLLLPRLLEWTYPRGQRPEASVAWSVLAALAGGALAAVDPFDWRGPLATHLQSSSGVVSGILLGTGAVVVGWVVGRLISPLRAWFSSLLRLGRPS